MGLLQDTDTVGEFIREKSELATFYKIKVKTIGWGISSEAAMRGNIVNFAAFSNGGCPTCRALTNRETTY